ncbi:hypothetical protein JD844_016825 [Phrynosoma platyrhinos]|uniref:Uncharacterized protein n=1 Tax=Phrynosoma platyrhinos TaxID=52577 RepID=A0ABQ7SKW4_PHRPL|nr:hypothetical protein JD844_016825 [Phrynosoma platyrhinos]
MSNEIFSNRYPVIQELITFLLNFQRTQLVGFLLVYALGIEILVSNVFSFFYRAALSFGLIAFSVWPLVSRLWTKAKVFNVPRHFDFIVSIISSISLCNVYVCVFIADDCAKLDFFMFTSGSLPLDACCRKRSKSLSSVRAKNEFSQVFTLPLNMHVFHQNLVIG